MAKTVYIHYGDDRFHDPRPIKNREYFTKPCGGLWASRKYGESTWKDWCFSEDFRVDTFDRSFEFTLKDDARVLELSDVDQFDNLPILSKEENGRCGPTYFLNFEELAKQYDAIEVTNIGNLYFTLYGWDCNSILIMNPDIVEVKEED